MSEQFILPPINASGVINLKDPFRGLCAVNVPYTVAGVRSFPDLLASGIDPYATYYEPNGIDQAVYNEHSAADVCILSLRSPSGDLVYVPNSYLETAPVATGVPYTNTLVGIKLGSMPDNLSLAYFSQQVKTLAHDLLGVNNAEVKTVKVSDPIYLSLEDAKTIEAARANVMKTVVTDAARLRVSEQERLKAIAKIAELEQYIRDHLV